MQDSTTVGCSVAACARAAYCRGMCSTHYVQWRDQNLASPCSVAGCTAPTRARGYCKTHGQQDWSARRMASGVECSVEGCARHLYRRSLCAAHYKHRDTTTTAAHNAPSTRTAYPDMDGTQRQRVYARNRTAVGCSAEGCARTAVVRGWCQMHYMRVLRHGDTSISRPPGRTPAPRLPCKVDGCQNTSARSRASCPAHIEAARAERARTPARAPGVTDAEWFVHNVRWEGECLVWAAGRYQNGYGKFCATDSGKARTTPAHRWIFGQERGLLPKGRRVLHSCDNPPCVLMGHLSANTTQATQVARVTKGRQAKGSTHGSVTNPQGAPRGENNGKSKLTETKVRGIRTLHATENYTYGEIADMFNVSPENISAIVRLKTWKHVI